MSGLRESNPKERPNGPTSNDRDSLHPLVASRLSEIANASPGRVCLAMIHTEFRHRGTRLGTQLGHRELWGIPSIAVRPESSSEEEEDPLSRRGLPLVFFLFFLRDDLFFSSVCLSVCLPVFERHCSFVKNS